MKKESLKNRREFFKLAAKKALPLLGLVTLGGLPQTAEAKELLGDCSCSYSCSGSCSTNCTGECKYGCGSSCAGECKGYCSGGCKDSCYLTSSGQPTYQPQPSSPSGGVSSCSDCSGGCKDSCSAGCRKACANDCTTTCKNGCGKSCDNGCKTTCSGGCKGSSIVYSREVQQAENALRELDRMNRGY